ncbi:nurim-like isoform X2 [Mya arenaria]|uniref:nurim-like isoform X2 n=2 Tax=Mya arenaria TaxID=6604 RepID=UPI0022E4EC02|nr:nurim-like isoform X2 [Mya arenaria]
MNLSYFSHMDSSTLWLFTTDATLVVLFMFQHSIMASKCYTNLMDNSGFNMLSRSVYVLSTSVILQVLMYYWQAIPEVMFWTINISESPMLALFFRISHWVLWILMFLQALVIKPLYHFGLSQVFDFLKTGDVYDDCPPRLKRLLSHLPHPGALSFIGILWLQPYMSYDRMILATVLTSYLCCVLYTTESDCVYVEQTVDISSSTVTTKRHKIMS